MKRKTRTVVADLRTSIARLLIPTALLVALTCGCSCTKTPSTAPVDLATAAADLECPPRACVAEDNEDCAGCFERIGNCCYLDPDWGEGPGTRDQLVARCLTNPGCTACCNECKQMSCEAMKKRGVCPYIP